MVTRPTPTRGGDLRKCGGEVRRIMQAAKLSLSIHVSLSLSLSFSLQVYTYNRLHTYRLTERPGTDASFNGSLQSRPIQLLGIALHHRS